MLRAVEPVADHYAGAVSPVVLGAGVGLVAAATVAGAWPAGRRDGHRQVWFGAGAVVLLVIAAGHLLPDAWSGAVKAGMQPWLVRAIAVASFALAALFGRLRLRGR
jgi:hypothetical protein